MSTLKVDTINTRTDTSLSIQQNDTTAITIDSSGNVGIGTSSPSTRLHLVASGSSGATMPTGTNVFIENNADAKLSIASPDANEAMIVLGSASDQSGSIFRYDHTDKSTTIGSQTINGIVKILSGNDNEKVRIDSSGNVGIGTSSPDGLLDITSSGTPTVIIQSSATSAQDAILKIRGSRTTNTGGDFCQILFETNDDASGGDELGFITAGKEQSNTNKGVIRFGTTSTDGGSPTEAMRIDSSGLIKGPLLCVVGERNNSAVVGAYLAFGNGSSNGDGVAMPFAGKIRAATINKTGGTSTTTFRLYINGSLNTNADLTVTNGSSTNTGLSIDFSAGDRINYQCSVASDASVQVGIFYQFNPN